MRVQQTNRIAIGLGARKEARKIIDSRALQNGRARKQEMLNLSATRAKTVVD